MRIGELSTRSDVSVRALRYYEQQGLLAPQRTAAGHRIYTAEDVSVVLQIQELFRAGFCSAVIRELLPALSVADRESHRLETVFDAATARLESEKASIETELRALQRLRERLELAPHAHVRMHPEEHDTFSPTSTTAFDHRDRRLR